MIEQEPIEECLVAVLKLAQVDVALQITIFFLERFISARYLLIERLDNRRQKTI